MYYVIVRYILCVGMPSRHGPLSMWPGSTRTRMELSSEVGSSTTVCTYAAHCTCTHTHTHLTIYTDLRQQIQDLKALLQSTTISQDDSSEVRSLRERLLESEKLMAETTRSWQEKLRQSEARKQEEMEQLKVRVTMLPEPCTLCGLFPLLRPRLSYF